MTLESSPSCLSYQPIMTSKQRPPTTLTGSDESPLPTSNYNIDPNAYSEISFIREIKSDYPNAFDFFDLTYNSYDCIVVPCVTLDNYEFFVHQRSPTYPIRPSQIQIKKQGSRQPDPPTILYPFQNYELELYYINKNNNDLSL